jgi:hypothetical protein
MVDLDVIGRHQFATLLDLIGRRPPLRIEHRFARPNRCCRIAMAVEAPLHCQRRRCLVRRIVSIGPWQVVQPIPLATWTE